MKKFLIGMNVIVLLLMLSVFVSANQGSIPEFKAGTYASDGELVSVKAKGLVCEFCAKALEKVFLKQKEVSGVHVDLTTKEILISLKKGKNLSDAEIAKLVKDSGYNIEEINRNIAQ